MSNKTATKVKKRTTKNGPALSEIEKKLVENADKEMVKTFVVNGEEVSITFKNHIDVEGKRSIIDSVESIYFPDGEYDKLRGDAIVSQLIFNVYTGLTFDNDSSVFDSFKSTETYDEIFSCMPKEVNELIKTIEDRVNYLKSAHNKSNEEKKVLLSVSGVISAFSSLVNNIDSSIGEAIESLKADDGFKLNDLLKALNEIDKKDEAKIARAILDFQEEKKKLEANKE